MKRIDPLPNKPALGRKRQECDTASIRSLVLAGASVREIARRLRLSSATAGRRVIEIRSSLSMPEFAAMKKNRESRKIGNYPIAM